MKKLPLLLITLVLLSGLWTVCSSGPEKSVEVLNQEEETAAGEEEIAEEAISLPDMTDPLPISQFNEVWAYVVAGREAALKGNLPITDIGYFGTEVDHYGKLVDIPNRRKLPAFKGRVHLVAACSSRPLTHFVLVEGSAERKQMVADLISASRDFDGLQIDFEYIPNRDGDAFRSFLAELRSGLKGKSFTIALPARVKRVQNDVYDYQKILPLVDRILVMAYDEHWSTSAPGPIASLPWCKRVAEYSLEAIGSEKLIMGLPFYGRAWGSVNPSKAYLYSGIEELIAAQKIAEIERENGIPTFKYEVPVSVKVYYEDVYSLSTRMAMYQEMGVRHIGFWRLGQETPAVWYLINIIGNSQ